MAYRHFNNTCLKYSLSLLSSTLRHRYSIATVFILRCKGIDKAFILRSKGMDRVLIIYPKVMIALCVRRIRAGRRSKIRLLLVIPFTHLSKIRISLLPEQFHFVLITCKKICDRMLFNLLSHLT
jgi:hypothetical protein